MNEQTDNTSDDEVMRRARNIATDVQPGRDLWPGIAAAIDVEPAAARNARWPQLFAQAAAVLLLVGASSGLTWLTMKGDDSAIVPTMTGGELAFEPVSGSFGSRYSLGPDFQDARGRLVSRLDAELERLPPETREDVEKNIAAIRAAIAEINKALADEPDNVLLQELLLSTYGEELAIMRRIDGISNSVMRRTDI